MITGYGIRKGKRPLLVLVYVAFLLVLFEGTARLSFMIPAISHRLQEDEDTTWRREWTRRHTKGVEIYYTFDMFDPTKGWVAKPHIRALQVFGNKVLNTNSRGLRGEQEYSYGKHPHKTRVLIFGDSFTFGDEVSDHETYSSYLQAMMPITEIINMGVHGYGHDQMLILLKEEGIKYRPDIVILGFLPADMSRNVLRFRDYAKPRFILDHHRLILTGSPVPRPEELLNWDWARPRLYDVWSLLRHKSRVRSGVYETQMTETTKRLLDDMVATIETAGAIPVFVYLPSGYEINTQNTSASDERFLFSYCREKNIVHCFSSRPHFVDNIKRGGELFTSSGHWTPLGHRTAAEAISVYLAAQNIASLQ